ncbi:MAG: hypothetical protein IJU92_01395 [Spirochaetaceae bacterium]|nr:hypothetical protein [Spirochaetaceae bacterium]
MEEQFFIKNTESNVSLTSEQKVHLNRRGNELFNSGDIMGAARIFVTTGYSDGLTRIGDHFFQKNEKITALKYYTLAKNKTNVDVLVQELTSVIRLMLN